jgi:MFS family permease
MSGALTHAAAPSERLPVAAIAVLTLGALDFGLEQSLIIPALPALATHYDTTVTEASWLATGFLLAGTVAVPLLGRLGDMYGKRRLLLYTLTAFAVGSLICALTSSIAVAIVGRVVQGSGSAITPLTLGLARDTLPPRLLTRAIGAVIGAASVGAAIGYVFGGLLVDHVSTAAIFWALLLFAVLLLAGLLLFVPESPVRARATADVPGAVLLGLGLFSLLLAISKGNAWGWSSSSIIALFAAAAGLLGAFVAVEKRALQPLVDLALVVKKPFWRTNVCVFAFGYTFFLAIFVVPLIAGAPPESGYGQGLTTTQIGLVLLPSGIASLAGAWVAGRSVDRVGPRVLIALGSVLGVGSYVALAVAHSSWQALVIPTAVLGFGTGAILTAIYPVVLRNTASDKTGVGVAVPVVVRNTAVTVGLAAAFAIVEAAGLTGMFTSETGFTRVFAMGALGAAVTLATSALMPGRTPVAARRIR